MIYVGKTHRLRKRLNEHKRVFGNPLLMEVVVSCSREEQDAQERKWIAHYRSIGECERNIANGGQGIDQHSQATKDRISKLLKVRPKPPEHGPKVSAAIKGKPRNWTKEGERRVRTTQFKKGRGRFADLPKGLQEKFIAARKKQWDGISKEERTRMATERNLQAWAKRDTEQRRKLGVNISQGIRERFSEKERQVRATRASLKAAEKWHSLTPEQKTLEIEKRGLPEERKAIASRASKELWANMTPERMAGIVAKRNASRKANRELKAKAASL